MGSALTFDALAKLVVGMCFGLLRVLKPILGFFDPRIQKVIIQAAIISRLDYCKILYLGTNKAVIRRLQLAQNAAVWLLFSLPKFFPISGLIHILHLLLVDKHVHFKDLCTAHKIFSLGWRQPCALQIL